MANGFPRQAMIRFSTRTTRSEGSDGHKTLARIDWGTVQLHRDNTHADAQMPNDG